MGDLPSKQRTTDGNVFRLWLEFAVTVASLAIAYVGGPTVSVARCRQCCAVPRIFFFIDYPLHPHPTMDQLKRPIRCCRHLANAAVLLPHPHLVLSSIVIILVLGCWSLEKWLLYQQERDFFTNRLVSPPRYGYARRNLR